MFRISHPFFHRRTAVISVITLVSLVVIVGITTFAASSAPPATKLPQSLTKPNLPFPTDAKIEPTHAALLHRDATARIEAATSFARNPPTRDPHTPTPIPTADHPGNRTGIIAGALPPPDDLPFRNEATIENFYRVFPNNFMFVVAAGVAKNDSQQGFIGVATAYHPERPAVGYLKPLNTSLTPTKHGSVHITAVNGSLVTLVAVDGTTFVFDDSTYTFK